MTALFALLVALLMAGVVLGVNRLEHQRSLARAGESLHLAMERARHEVDEVSHESGSHKSLVQMVQAEQGEIAAGGLTLLVVQGQHVLWQSRNTAPPWPRSGSHWNVSAVPFGAETLVIARSSSLDDEQLHTTTNELIAISVVVVAATAVLAWFIVGQTLSPIVRLADQAQNATLKGLLVRLQTPSSDAEMSHLTQTLNTLLGRLEREAQGRAYFYAAASHELRTPIQILLGEIEVARSRPRSTEEYEDVLLQVHQGTERLATLVQDLLQLNALEMHQNQTLCEKINVAFWVERAVSQQNTKLEKQALSVDMQLAEDALIDAPPTHIEVLLRNLLENAVKYAQPKTSICVDLTASSKASRFEIYNAYNLDSDVQLDEWFEPFYRPDASRNSQTGGNGLGLAICRALCNANHWIIELQRRECGVAAIVIFPNE